MIDVLLGLTAIVVISWVSCMLSQPEIAITSVIFGVVAFFLTPASEQLPEMRASAWTSAIIIVAPLAILCYGVIIFVMMMGSGAPGVTSLQIWTAFAVALIAVIVVAAGVAIIIERISYYSVAYDAQKMMRIIAENQDQ